VTEVVLSALDRRLTVAVSVYASGTTPDSAADDTLTSALTLLLADRTLGLGSNVQVLSVHELRWDFDNYEYARVVAMLQVDYR
jgi:hypothetical protein